jgi:excisionase family DNA binding protein
MQPADANRTIRTRGPGEMVTPAPVLPTRNEPTRIGSAGDWLSRTDVARLFQVSASTVTRWAREGKVPAKRTPGGHYRYPAAEIRRLAGTSGPGDFVRLD